MQILDISVGCDWLSVSYPVADADLCARDTEGRLVWRSRDAGSAESADDSQPERSAGYQRTVKFGRATVWIVVWRVGDNWRRDAPPRTWATGEDAYWASVRFNPSRLHDPYGWSLCPASSAQFYACALVVWLGRAGIVVPDCRHLNDASLELQDFKGQALGRSCCEDQECLMSLVRVSRVDASIDFHDVIDTALWVSVLHGYRQARVESTEVVCGAVTT